METLWGIDLGGTKIEGIVLNPATGDILTRQRIPTEGQFGYHHVLSQIKKMVDLLAANTGLKPVKIGMGTPGSYDPIQYAMKNCNSTSLNGQNLNEDINSLVGIPFILSNDANCFAVAEANFGCIKDHMPEAKVVFGVIMGTGVGGGLVVDGKVLNGRQGICGEWGHNHLDDSGGSCYCGKTGCVETIISGPALENFYEQISGARKSLKEIVDAYRKEGDIHATATMERLFHFFGKAVSVVINIIDPDAIVIGGGVGNIDELYTKGVEEVKKLVFNLRLDTKFFKPTLGDSAGVFGAAFL
jgi:fructokinase